MEAVAMDRVLASSLWSKPRCLQVDSPSLPPVPSSENPLPSLPAFFPSIEQAHTCPVAGWPLVGYVSGWCWILVPWREVFVPPLPHLRGSVGDGPMTKATSSKQLRLERIDLGCEQL